MPLHDYRGGRARTRPLRDRLNWQITGVGLAIVTLVLLGITLYMKSEAVAVPTDPATLCRTTHPPSQVTVILLDVSDRFTDRQRLQIQNDLARERDSIPRFGLVELYTVDRVAARVTEPVVHLCNPGTGADLNRIYQNPDLARHKWQEFATKLGTDIDKQISLPDAPTSPIFEAIQATALRTFGKPEYDRVPKRLVIVSDLLQNVPGELSMYDGIPSFDSFRATPYFSHVRADLEGVAVRLYYLARATPPVQPRPHIRFWESYFASQGAAVESVERVFGDQ